MGTNSHGAVGWEVCSVQMCWVLSLTWHRNGIWGPIQPCHQSNTSASDSPEAARALYWHEHLTAIIKVQQNSQTLPSHHSPGSPVAPRSWRSCLRLSLALNSRDKQDEWQVLLALQSYPLVQLLIKVPLPAAPPAPQQPFGHPSVSNGKYWSPGAQLTPCAQSGRKLCPAVCSLSPLPSQSGALLDELCRWKHSHSLRQEAERSFASRENKRKSQTDTKRERLPI